MCADAMTRISGSRRRAPHRVRVALRVMLGVAFGLSLAARPASAQISMAQSSSAAAAPSARVPLDRVVAIVNDDLILESDVDAEKRFSAFQPPRSESAETRKQIVERLIDRDLIQQQMRMQMQPPPVSDSDLDRELLNLRKTIPECAEYHCETDVGWQTFCADHGFTPEQVRVRWRARMQLLDFVEQRFRMGIQISRREIDSYYNTSLVPAYRKRGIAPPAENTMRERIQEVLLEQQVTGLLDDWIKALRAEGSIRIVVLDDSSGADPDEGPA
jgi:peptidyl-prolyl cis-trans isomerase SurA